MFPPHIPPMERRIRAGEPWLHVYQQQLAVPLSAMARKTKIAIDDLISMTQGTIEPDDGQLAAIAKALGTTAQEIEETHRLAGSAG
ncbi:hypothetical protein [Sphingomonas sp. LaA6.9]|uniref:hypothetical protein n=1 Tax=Sphingomonas sp. LaA6.9 TaxID=2919914 RepID=UPI001F4F1E7A|nr:hypothetical protein [Sphingomonas sp. LaA6.9]MCJ8158360.1 hypothetical protein [Sphingomonas sp. LaA6.9]